MVLPNVGLCNFFFFFFKAEEGCRTNRRYMEAEVNMWLVAGFSVLSSFTVSSSPFPSLPACSPLPQAG